MMSRRRQTDTPYEGEDRRRQPPGWGFLFRRLRSGAIIGWLAVAALILRVVGYQYLPADIAVVAVTHRVDSLQTRVIALELMSQETAANTRKSVYISCQVLAKVSPGSLMPQECK